MADGHLHAATRARDALAGTKASAKRFAAELERQHPDPSGLEALNLPDLFLAWAALEQDPAALKELDRRLAVCAQRLNADSIDDLLQVARQRLLIGEGRAPKLRGYSGHGALVKWLRTVLLSLSIDHARKAKPDKQAGDDQLAVKASSEAGADVRLMNAQNRAAFNRAFEASLETLTAQERTVLRMRFVDGLSVEEVGKTFGVHRTTALRWLEAAFQKVLKTTRATLAEQLKLRSSELDSLFRAFEPSLNERLSRLLPPAAPR